MQPRSLRWLFFSLSVCLDVYPMIVDGCKLHGFGCWLVEGLVGKCAVPDWVECSMPGSYGHCECCGHSISHDGTARKPTIHWYLFGFSNH